MGEGKEVGRGPIINDERRSISYSLGPFPPVSESKGKQRTGKVDGRPVLNGNATSTFYALGDLEPSSVGERCLQGTERTQAGSFDPQDPHWREKALGIFRPK